MDSGAVSLDAETMDIHESLRSQLNDGIAQLRGEEHIRVIFMAVPDDSLKSSTNNALAAYQLSVTGDKNDIITVRYLTETDGKLYIRKNGDMKESKYVRDGRYIVFELENGDVFLFTEADETQNNYRAYIICAVGTAVLFLLIVTVTAIRKKRRKAAAKTDIPTEERNSENES